MIEIKKTKDGMAYLHLWRDGEEYEQQKEDRLAEEWTNIRFDLMPNARRSWVHAYDVRKGLPFPNATFDAIYAYHIMEHLTFEEGKRFVQDVLRALKPNGIFRTSVPDLEGLCKGYLSSLEQALADPSERSLAEYECCSLKLFEQMVREREGGLHATAIKKRTWEEEDVRRLMGDTFRTWIGTTDRPLGQRGFLAKFKSRSPKEIFLLALRKAQLLLWRHDPRKTGEAVKWMNDRLSLGRLLQEEGFAEVAPTTYNESRIPNWDRHDLDRSNYGDYPFDPPSIYVEGRKSN